MQADQTVLSLRPGGGGNRGKVLGPRFESSAFGSSDLPLLRPHGGGAHPDLAFKTGESRFEGRDRVRYSRDQLLQLREVVNIPEEILKIKQEVETEVFGEDQNWTSGEGNLQTQPQNNFSEPETRDWRGRFAAIPTSVEDKSWDAVRENRDFGGRFDPRHQEANQYNRQDQLSSQFARGQISSNQGVAEPRKKGRILSPIRVVDEEDELSDSEVLQRWQVGKRKIHGVFVDIEDEHIWKEIHEAYPHTFEDLLINDAKFKAGVVEDLVDITRKLRNHSLETVNNLRLKSLKKKMGHWRLVKVNFGWLETRILQIEGALLLNREWSVEIGTLEKEVEEDREMVAMAREKLSLAVERLQWAEAKALESEKKLEALNENMTERLNFVGNVNFDVSLGDSLW